MGKYKEYEYISGLTKEQFKKREIVTQLLLENMKNKNYHNGEPIKVGDEMLIGLNVTIENELELLSVITLKESHLELYEINPRYKSIEAVPVIRLKG